MDHLDRPPVDRREGGAEDLVPAVDLAEGGGDQGGLYSIYRDPKQRVAGAELVGDDQWRLLRQLVEKADPKTIVLNVDPGCRRADEAKLTWLRGLPGLYSVIARIAPFLGLIETIADAGSEEYGSVSRIALSAKRCRSGSMVV